MWMTLSEFSPCVFYWEKKWIKEKEKGKRGMRHYHLHPSGLRCSNLLNITVTFASRSRKGWSSSLYRYWILHWPIALSCYPRGWQRFWWRIHTTQENPKRLVNNIDYLNKGQKTLDQITTSILDRLHSFLSNTIHSIQPNNTYPYTPFLYYPFLAPNPTFLYNLILLVQPISIT